MTHGLRVLAAVALLAVPACVPSSTEGPASGEGTETAIAIEPTFDASADSSFVIIPGVRIGPIGQRTTEAELIATFGELDVRRERVYLTEGFCTLGTRVLPGTPDELQIAWRDSARTRIAMIRFQGEDARWHTPSGVRIGTTLKELEEISQSVIEFSGFGWDLGGGCEWLEPGENGLALGLWLDPDDAFHSKQDPRASEVYGEQLVRSDHPVIRDGTVLVRKIYQNWGFPYVELDCF